ncbi:sulfotransferase [Pseudoalteromonas sp. MB41]|uniref:tetratricopeptide repeat-containing sulfotransferase family protein n=1 Tax=Pseudoalteromonas sp. MB41 TaxID=2896366 RepID=UPI001E5E79A3|nr:sulfotransferase [Pseudoalteromonas sp. MB41]MCC9662095.1 sulfotransferase [Pseudoalteromonas sp. MB41]
MQFKQSQNYAFAGEINKLLDIAWHFINQKNVVKAKQACQAINEQYPKSADGWYASSFLSLQLQEFTSAINTADKTLALEPQQPQWLIHKINILLNIDKTAAITLSEKLKSQAYNHFKNIIDCAHLFTQLADYNQAQFYYQRAIKRINENNQPKAASQLYFNLASVERYLGNINQAECLLNKAITLNPNDSEAYFLRSSLKKQQLNNHHINELTLRLKNEQISPLAKTQFYYARAKEQEDIADYANSFKSLYLGAEIRRANMRYAPNADIDTLKQIATTYNHGFFKAHKGAPRCENNQAIFILGLPRTGSTLVERIISQHDQVVSAGELNDFALQMINEVKKNSQTQPKSKTELVELSQYIDFKSLGENYINQARPSITHQQRFIDKLPLNSLYIGLIHQALPNAKIIHVTRHPLDTCYSMYKQLFTHGYPFSYNLEELAHYYVEHHQLMQHWQTLLPKVIHQVSYEDLVTDLPNQAKQLIDYCDLDWQAQCCEFEKNNAPSTTASATQVRQKIYQSSKGKWQHFANELSPIQKILEQAGVCCD